MVLAATTSSAIAGEGVETSNAIEIMFDREYFDNFWANVNPDEVMITMSEQRIYASEHIFGVIEVIDDHFKAGAKFVETRTISMEHSGFGGISAMSSGCRPGQHTNAAITSIFHDISHGGWGRPGGFCIAVQTAHWVCFACNSTGTDQTFFHFFCASC